MRKEVGLAYRTSLPRRPLFAGAKTPRSSYTFPTGILARDPGRAVHPVPPILRVLRMRYLSSASHGRLSLPRNSESRFDYSEGMFP